MKNITNMPSVFRRIFVSTSIARIWYHFQNDSFGIVSGFKTGDTKESNLDRQANLMARVKDMGYGYVPIKGFWEGIEERSVFIPQITKEDARKLANLFEQNAYVWGNQGEWWCFDSSSNNSLFQGDNFAVSSLDNEAQNYSQYKQKKFMFASVMNLIKDHQEALVVALKETKLDQAWHLRKTIQGYEIKAKKIQDQLKLMQNKFKIKDNLNKLGQSGGYWINPNGEIIQAYDHFKYILSHPDKFVIENDREKDITKALQDNWIRVRGHGYYTTFEFWQMDMWILERIKMFLKAQEAWTEEQIALSELSKKDYYPTTVEYILSDQAFQMVAKYGDIRNRP